MSRKEKMSTIMWIVEYYENKDLEEVATTYLEAAIDKLDDPFATEVRVVNMILRMESVVARREQMAQLIQR